MAEYKARRARKRAHGGAAPGEGHEGPPHGAHMVIMIAVPKGKKKRRAGGKVEGDAARHHLGKRARGAPMKRAGGGSAAPDGDCDDDGRARGGRTLDAREAANEPWQDGRDKVPQRSGTEERAVEMGDPGRLSGGPVMMARGGMDNDRRAIGGRLTAAERQRMPRSDFALPGKGTGPKGAGAGSYPIGDISHAKNALARVAQHGSPAEQAQVRRAVHRKYPSLGED